MTQKIEWWTIHQAAAAIGVTSERVRQLVRDLGGIKIIPPDDKCRRTHYRFPADTVRAFAERRRAKMIATTNAKRDLASARAR